MINHHRFFLAYVLKKDSDDVCLVEVKKVLLTIHDQPIDDGWMAMDHWVVFYQSLK